MENKVILIIGPTSSGKTKLSMEIAEYIKSFIKKDVAILNADSRQIYKGLNIGTNKITSEEMRGIPHYLLSEVEPTNRLDTDNYKEMAEKLLEQLSKSSTVPIIVGGTATYFLALYGDYILKQPKFGEKLESDNILIITPKFESRDVLYRKVEESTEEMFKNGLFEEVKDLNRNQAFQLVLNTTLGYREFLEYSRRNRKKVEQLSYVDQQKIKWKIKTNTKKFAMNQINLLKKLDKVNTIEGDQYKDVINEFLK
ncbi:MAG: isopentenyl transferase family protein [Candidatus Dojkabacteria bacterium]|nr:isopentenyl transferase family protein [Candidatus Dojkabacteria bacterium]MDQ7021614.1 isopentenyl transferase family protein [Candidatus Dojkabacteria bacterium]